MKEYRSKIDVWLVALIAIPFCFAIVFIILQRAWVALLSIVPTIIFLGCLFYHTKYIINGSALHVKAWFLVNTKIPVSEITSVKQTNNPLSAPALSLSRLEIKYGKHYDYVLVSPKDRKGFLQQLIALNPGITINDNLK